MFGKPKYGCVDLYIGEYDYEVYSLTDIPINFLTSMLFALKEDKDFCVSVEFDYPSWMKIISDYYDTYLIINGHFKVIKDFNKWMLAMEIFDDFRSDFDDWCNWRCHMDPEELADYPEKFLRLLEELSVVLRNPRWYLQKMEGYGERQRSFYDQLGKNNESILF